MMDEKCFLAVSGVVEGSKKEEVRRRKEGRKEEDGKDEGKAGRVAREWSVENLRLLQLS